MYDDNAKTINNVFDSNFKECYLVNRIVVILRDYPQFGLTKIRYKYEDIDFIVDNNLLLNSPDNTYTISLKLIGGL